MVGLEIMVVRARPAVARRAVAQVAAVAGGISVTALPGLAVRMGRMAAALGGMVVLAVRV